VEEVKKFMNKITTSELAGKYYVNLAKAVLGKNGGYTLRDWKKIYKLEKEEKARIRERIREEES